MPSSTSRLLRPRIAIAVLFFTNATVLSAWIPRLAEMQVNLGMSDLTLGVVLGAGAAGGIVAGLSAGPLMHRYGSRRVALVMLGCSLPVLPLLGLAPNAWLLGTTIFVLGAFDAIMDAAMNSHALRAQHELKRLGNTRSILNTFHGFWSLGAVVGALVGVLTANAGIDLFWSLIFVSAINAVLVLATQRWLLTGPDPETFLTSDGDNTSDAKLGFECIDQVDAASAQSQASARTTHQVMPATLIRNPVIWGLGAFIVLAIMMEDIPGRWSSIYLTDIGAPVALVGWGFVAFTAAMTLGRFLGDRIVDALGDPLWTRIGMTTSAVVITAALLSQFVWAFVLACAIVGFCVATLFPAAMRAAAHIPGVRPSSGIAALTWLSRAGFVAAPLLVGVVAEAQGVAWGIGVAVAAALALVPLSSLLRSERSR